MNFKSLFFYLVAVCTVFAVGCDEDTPAEPTCTLTCTAPAVLLADCTCFTPTVVDTCDSCGPSQICEDGVCKEDPNATKEETKSGLITADETWTENTIYTMSGKVVVDDGATLTIEPGTIIKGATGAGSLASALVVARGGKLMAEGTADKPIIFTSVDDNISRGQISGTSLTETANGLWGGLIILGYAPISVGGDADFAQIEGIPADDNYGRYGGNDATDNSGVIKYVSVRHGGALIGDGNEINGITLGGVGTGTTIENVEVVANKDDGIEWFGGTVNVTNALIWAADDDGVDIDQAYSGTIDNFIVICNGTDHALEIDGPEGTATGAFTLTNGSIKGDDQELGNMRDGATGALSNIYFFAFSEDPNTQIPCAEGDDCYNADASLNGTKAKGEGDFKFSGDNTDAAYAAGTLSFAGFEATPLMGVGVADIFGDFTMMDQDAVGVVAQGANTQGATVSAFAWTYANANGALADFN